MCDTMRSRPPDVVQQGPEAHEAQVKIVSVRNNLFCEREGRTFNRQAVLDDFFGTPGLAKRADRFLSVGQQLPNKSKKHYHLSLSTMIVFKTSGEILSVSQYLLPE
jgi:hypothetical protein